MEKNFKKALALLTAIAIVGGANYVPQNENFSIKNSISVSAESINGELSYEVVGEEVVITGVNGEPKNIIIPEEIEGYPVTSIGKSAFLGCSSLTTIEIPNSVMSIGGYVFNDCRNLTEIIVDENNLNYCDVDGVLFDKNKTELYRFPEGKSTVNYAIPDTVKNIGNEAFIDCSELQSIEIPNSVTSIGYSAFYSCTSLTSIYIPNSVTSIDEYVFYDCCNLTEIIVDEDNLNFCDVDGVLFDKNKTELYRFPEGKSTLNYAIPDTVRNVGNNAFSNGVNLQSIEILNSVMSIGSSAFSDCESLQSIEIPNSVMSIGHSAFWGCSSLKSISIADSVTSIHDWAFFDCISLETISIPNSVTNIGNHVFKGCNSLKSIEIPDSVTSIGYGSFCDCNSLKSIIIPRSIDYIGNYAVGYREDRTKIDGFKIYGYENSKAQNYATENEIEFMDVEGVLSGENNYDVDGNGKVTTLDLVKIKKQILGYETEYSQTADFNQDSKVDAKDLAALVKYLIEN